MAKELQPYTIMAEVSEEHHAKIAQFCDLTGATTGEVCPSLLLPLQADKQLNSNFLQAEEYLATNEWDLEGSVAEYFTTQEEGIEHAQGDDSDEAAGGLPEGPPTTSGARTLGGAPAPPSSIPTVSSSRNKDASRQPPTNKKFATLKDLNSEAAHSHNHDDDDEDEDGKDLYAGGEKSALAVQNPGDPRKQVKDILNKARK